MKVLHHVQVFLSTPQRVWFVAAGIGSKVVCGISTCWLMFSLTAMAQEAPQAVPSFAALEEAGATVGEIRVVPMDIFDTQDPAENYALFRLANRLHIQTRESVIRRALLFQTGDRLQVREIEETERLLRSNRYLYDVVLRPVAVRDGVVDIEVVTRDTWSLNVGAGLSRTGGTNSSKFELTEENLFGTGTRLSLRRTNDIDRSSRVIEYGNNRAFGTWTAVALSHAANSDGQTSAVSVVRPFYALDARWTAGVTATSDDRIDSIYSGGVIASQYRVKQTQANVFGGWSDGLVDGWVRRRTVGLSAVRVRYATEPGLVAPTPLPGDDEVVGPYFRYDLIEDRFDRELNRNLVGRPEFFAVGLNASVQVQWVSKALGSSRNTGLYSASVSRGFEPMPDQTLIARAALSGEMSRSGSQYLSAAAQYYLPQSPRRLFYASAEGDWITHPGAIDSLLLGGDNGLRGYPLRYQSGARRMLFTVEQRFYTDVYPWRLFRIGGAAFLDVGRAWGGTSANATNPGWLSDVGFGLRIVSVRSAFSNVLHIDLAIPLNRDPDISKVQLLVKSKKSF
jgi:hypothetical protein